MHKLPHLFLDIVRSAKNIVLSGTRQLKTAWLKLCHPQGTFRECNGAEVYCDFSSRNYCWYDGNSSYLKYELEVFTSLFEKKPPLTILDIGAHWGFYPAFLDTGVYSKQIKRIIAVEADPANQIVLARTLTRMRNIQVTQINYAISEQTGRIPLYSDDGDCRHTYSSAAATVTTEVESITLDDLSTRFLTPDEEITHIKLDIDGAEPSFFRGAQKTLARFRPLILTEFWAKGIQASGENIQSYWEMLQLNYVVQEFCFPERTSKTLAPNDLDYLAQKTMVGITNLVLSPKSSSRHPVIP